MQPVVLMMMCMITNDCLTSATLVAEIKQSLVIALVTANNEVTIEILRNYVTNAMFCNSYMWRSTKSSDVEGNKKI